MPAFDRRKHYHNSLDRDRRPSSRAGSIQRVNSSADISTYGCGDGSRKLQILASIILLIASLVMIGTGAGLMGFYRIHMLDVIAVEFLIVPLILLVGGLYTFFTALFGVYATMREDSCLMVTYSIFLALEFIVLLGGVVASVRLIFDIRTGLFDSDVVPELAFYETDPYIRYKWDTLQREFTCCGGYGFAIGYQDWKHTVLGGQHNSVPDSCCLKESQLCGKNIFVMTDPRRIFQSIHTHGCITIMQHRLENHVSVILIVFCVVGGILAMLQLLGIVLACCFANQIAKMENEDWEYNEYAVGNGGDFTRPPTPQTMHSNDLSSHHETAF